MNTDLVSVIVTTFNRSTFLKDTIDSIHKQTYDNLEILVIDDGSSKIHADINKEVCNQFSKCNYYFKPNSGQPDSRNFGIKKTKGYYIGFCDDDDLWHPQKLELQIQILKKYEDFSIVTGDIEYINEDGSRTNRIKSHIGYNHGYIFDKILIKNRTASITPLFKKEIFNKVGCFNNNFIIAEDWEFWRRVSYYYKFYAINKVLAYVRVHGNSMTSNKDNSPLSRLLLYRRLTQSLLDWGKKRFKKKDLDLIKSLESVKYFELISNNFPGIKGKLRFLINLMRINFGFALQILILFFKRRLIYEKS